MVKHIGVPSKALAVCSPIRHKLRGLSLNPPKEGVGLAS